MNQHPEQQFDDRPRMFPHRPPKPHLSDCQKILERAGFKSRGEVIRSLSKINSHKK